MPCAGELRHAEDVPCRGAVKAANHAALPVWNPSALPSLRPPEQKVSVEDFLQVLMYDRHRLIIERSHLLFAVLHMRPQQFPSDGSVLGPEQICATLKY